MLINTIHHKSCIPLMEDISGNSIGLMITSPPYNVGMPYDEYLDNQPVWRYLAMYKQLFAEAARVMEDGGKIVINIANSGRSPYIPMASYINVMAVGMPGLGPDDPPVYPGTPGLYQWGELIWDKGEGAARSNAHWGSYASQKNPQSRDCHEYMLVYYKGKPGLSMKGVEPDINGTEFAQSSISIWRMKAETNSEHPAPFPEELPMKVIKYLCPEGKVVLDPFMGSGTTAVAAYKLNRKFIGYEISQTYIDMTWDRLRSAGYFTVDPLTW